MNGVLGGFARNAFVSHLRNGVTLESAASLPPEPINWLWSHYLALGKLHLLAGAPGTGKTTLAIRMAAIVSCGGAMGGFWPDGTPACKGYVIIVTKEDGIEDTIIPRLLAAGADLDYVRIVRFTRDHGVDRNFELAKDISKLKAAIAGLGNVKLVIVDPIIQAVSGDSNRNADVRKSLEALVALAEDHGFAILGLTHLNKGSASKEPLDRINGSLAYGAVARVVLFTAEIKSDTSEDETVKQERRFALIRIKSNLGKSGDGFVYRLVEVGWHQDDGFIQTTKAEWAGTLTGSPRELLQQANGTDGGTRSTAVDAACEFLLSRLANGPQLARDMEAQAAATGISSASLKRARALLGILSKKQPNAGQASGFIWQLPPSQNSPLSPQPTPWNTSPNPFGGIAGNSSPVPASPYPMPFHNVNYANPMQPMQGQAAGYIQPEPVEPVEPHEPLAPLAPLAPVDPVDPPLDEDYLADCSNLIREQLSRRMLGDGENPNEVVETLIRSVVHEVLGGMDNSRMELYALELMAVDWSAHIRHWLPAPDEPALDQCLIEECVDRIRDELHGRILGDDEDPDEVGPNCIRAVVHEVLRHLNANEIEDYLNQLMPMDWSADIQHWFAAPDEPPLDDNLLAECIEPICERLNERQLQDGQNPDEGVANCIRAVAYQVLRHLEDDDIEPYIIRLTTMDWSPEIQHWVAK